MTKTIRIATRKSPLALWQAEEVARQLKLHHADLEVELVTMTTQGDIILDTPLAKIGGKGLFVKELETGMLEGRADIAVHSMKDVPMDCPDGLALGVICQREDPSDAFVSNNYSALEDLPMGAVVGTSSLRRECQLRARRTRTPGAAGQAGGNDSFPIDAHGSLRSSMVKRLVLPRGVPMPPAVVSLATTDTTYTDRYMSARTNTNKT